MWTRLSPTMMSHKHQKDPLGYAPMTDPEEDFGEFEIAEGRRLWGCLEGHHHHPTPTPAPHRTQEQEEFGGGGGSSHHGGGGRFRRLGHALTSGGRRRRTSEAASSPPRGVVSPPATQHQHPKRRGRKSQEHTHTTDDVSVHASGSVNLPHGDCATPTVFPGASLFSSSNYSSNCNPQQVQPVPPSTPKRFLRKMTNLPTRGRASPVPLGKSLVHQQQQQAQHAPFVTTCSTHTASSDDGVESEDDTVTLLPRCHEGVPMRDRPGVSPVKDTPQPQLHPRINSIPTTTPSATPTGEEDLGHVTTPPKPLGEATARARQSPTPHTRPAYGRPPPPLTRSTPAKSKARSLAVDDPPELDENMPHNESSIKPHRHKDTPPPTPPPTTTTTNTTSTTPAPGTGRPSRPRQKPHPSTHRRTSSHHHRQRSPSPVPGTWYYSSNHILINEERAQRDISTLRRSGELDQEARAAAEIMVKRGKMLRSDLKLLSQKLSFSEGVLGENVACGHSIREVHAKFMKNSVDRGNLLDPRFTEMGIGTARVAGGSSGEGDLYVCQLFRG